MNYEHFYCTFLLTQKRHLGSTLKANFVMIINVTTPSKIFRQFPVKIVQNLFMYQWLLWVIYLGTVRAPGRAVHFEHA